MECCDIGEVFYGKSSDVGVAVTSEKYEAPESESEAPLSSSEEEDLEEPVQRDVLLAQTSPDAVSSISKPIGGGVLADVPLHHEAVQCEVEELDALKRNWQLQQMQLRSNERLVSVIYETKGTKSVRMPDGAIINIPVQLPRTKVRPEKLYDFFFMVENFGVWKTRSAEYKNRCARASVGEFKSLCVVTRLKPEEHTVSSVGYKFVSSNDTDVIVEFPEGAVEKDTKFKFTVESVDQKRSKEYQTYNPAAFSCILGFTTTLHVQHVKDTCLVKHVEVQLPIHKNDDCVFDADDDDDSDVVFLRWEGDNVEIVKSEPKKIGDCYSVLVSHFSGYSAVKKDRSASPQDVLTAARILAGRENLCTLLSFIKFRVLGPLVLLDVVESCRADRVARRHRNQGLKEIEFSRSRDIPISDRERIKIELTGNLVPVPGIPRDAYNLTFVKAAASNNVTFPLRTRVSSSSYSIINFRGARGRWVHSIHFNVTMGLRSARNALLFPTTLTLPIPSAFQPEMKYRPVSDVPVTRVLFKQRESPDSQSDDNRPTTSQTNDNRPTTSQSTMSLWSMDAGSEMDAMFERPVSRGVSVRSPATPTPSVATPTSSPDTPTRSTTAESSQDKHQYKGHPMLSERSLQVLSEQLSLTEWTRVMVELSVSSSDIARVCEEATSQNFSPSFKLLVYWTHGNQGRPDRDLVNDLVAAFTELGRIDMAEVIRKAGRTYRNLKRSDFKKIS